MTLHRTWPMLALLIGGAVQAGTAPPADSPNEYAYSLPLNVSGNSGIVAFRLPQAVYLHAQTPDLSDIGMFDSQGNPLSFALEAPAAQSRISQRSLAAHVFPVMGNANEDAAVDAGGLDIRTDTDGRLLSVATRPESHHGASDKPRQNPGKPELAGLILDLGLDQADSKGDARPVINALSFTLPDGVDVYTARVWLEVSENLKTWDALGASELNWLVAKSSGHETQTLANDKIEFAPRRFRYARLSWQQGTALRFAAVNAQASLETDIAAQTEHILLQARAGKQAQDWVYRSAIAIPVEKIGLSFNEQNIVLASYLGNYQAVPGRQIGQPATLLFQPLVSATFYQISQAGQVRSSGDLSITPIHNAQWVLRTQGGAKSPPNLRLTWTPSTLLFLANGNAPYRLAFGRAHGVQSALETRQIAPGFKPSELLGLEQAQAGLLETHQSIQAQQQADNPSGSTEASSAGSAAHLRMGILWAVLALGLAVLGFIAWRLLSADQQQGDNA